jgi:hypothetical protein
MARDPDNTHKGKKRLLSPRSDVSRDTRKKQPDPKPAAELSPDVKAAVAVGEEILRVIEDDVRDAAKAKNAAFFEGVEEKAKAICDSIGRFNRVSEGQRVALDNMLTAVKKWVHGGRDDD